MHPLSANTVIGTALALAAGSSLASQIASARVLRLLKLRHASVWEEVMSRPDSWRFNRRTVSSGRVLRITRQQSPSLNEDGELQRAVGFLHISHKSVMVFFVLCLVAALLHSAKMLP
jgi:hypothetical protein